MKPAFAGILFLALTAWAQARVPSHIPTWAYDEDNAQGATASAQQVRRYVTYAEGGLGNDKALRDCGGWPKECFSVWYFDPHFVYDSPQCPYQPDQRFIDVASESWFVHFPGYSDAAHRVRGSYPRSCKGTTTDVPVYVTNIANPAVRAYFARYLQDNADLWDAYMMDDTGATLVNQMYGPGGGFCRGLNLNGWCTSTQELPNDAALLRAQGALADGLRRTDRSPMPFFVNGDPLVLGTSAQYVGAVLENAIVDAGTFRTAMYEKTLNEMASVEARGKKFVLLDTGDAPAGSADQIAQRIVTTAVAWLGFRPGQTVVWPDLEYNTHNLAVWPEDELYPTRPLQSMSNDASPIAVAPGVWRREFRACYDDGRSIGPCAALLNANGAPQTVRREWLHASFRHVVTLSGGDVLDGGAVSLARAGFAPGRTEVPAGGALLLAR